MNVWTAGALALTAGVIPCGVVMLRGTMMSRLVALELSSLIGVLVLVMLAMGGQEAGVYDIAIALAVLSFPSGLVFADFLGRWL